MENILQQLNTIFRDILDNNSINLQFKTVADDVEDWDSLNHIQLVVAIEKHFKIRFTAQEITSWKNVGDICNSIQQKVS